MTTEITKKTSDSKAARQFRAVTQQKRNIKLISHGDRQCLDWLAQYAGVSSEFLRINQPPDDTLSAFILDKIEFGDKVMLVGPTGEMLKETISKCGGVTIEFYEEEPFLPDMAGIMNNLKDKIKIIYLGNPNIYTGTVYSVREIEDILNLIAPAFLILDETCFEYSDISAADLIGKYENLSILRSLPGSEDIYESPEKYIISMPTNPQDIGQYNRQNQMISACSMTAPTQFRHLYRNKINIRRMKQEMLALALRIRSRGLEYRLTPQGSLLVRVAEIPEVCACLRAAGVPTIDISDIPNLDGYVLLIPKLHLDSSVIIEQLDTISGILNRSKSRHSMTIHRGSETDYKAGENNRDIFADRTVTQAKN